MISSAIKKKDLFRFVRSATLFRDRFSFLYVLEFDSFPHFLLGIYHSVWSVVRDDAGPGLCNGVAALAFGVGFLSMSMFLSINIPDVISM